MSLTTATDKLRTRLGAEVILPDDPGYDEARALHNAMIDKRPAVIVRCGSATDIAARSRIRADVEPRDRRPRGRSQRTRFRHRRGGPVQAQAAPA